MLIHNFSTNKVLETILAMEQTKNPSEELVVPSNSLYIMKNFLTEDAAG